MKIAALEGIQRRVLWLATRMVHEANYMRDNPDKTKVGGHQASSASVVSILTALYFGGCLEAGDRVSIKPHASPVYHAIQYLLGQLDRKYLKTLREFGGLQAYPSRTKDPDGVDFSTGSVGLGAVAPLFAALVERYASTRFAPAAGSRRRRFISLMGDAELDEGSVWEAISDETIRGTELGNVFWIVDLNRQSLDRIIPGIKVREVEALFSGAGWHVLEAKWGKRLRAAFARPGGKVLERRLVDMSNEEYQDLVRAPTDRLRNLLSAGLAERERATLCENLKRYSDDELRPLISDLGGHDLETLLAAYRAAAAETTRPSVLFAYTMKGWGLPIAGDRLNHSALLSQAQIDELRSAFGIALDAEWDAFPVDTDESRLCAEAARRLYPDGARQRTPPLSAADVPAALSARFDREISTQEVFGNTLTELARRGGPLAERLVTASPDVAISTNLGGWVNRVGVWAERPASRAEDSGPHLLRWEPGPSGQHIELGISEMNLFMLLGQLGLSHELNGELLLPVGTVYDPFVCRGLDALVYGVYSQSKFVFAGTPAGVSLSPEGGAHQSSITPSIGIELPNLRFWEPCFARETQWCLLEGLRLCADRARGASTYLRLSTQPVEQTEFERLMEREGEETLHAQALRGGYRLLTPDDSLREAPPVVIAASGPILSEAMVATRELWDEGVGAVLLNVTSPERLLADWRDSNLRSVRSARRCESRTHLEELVRGLSRVAPPIVTVLDGASHALAFLGGAVGARVVPLGVDIFGQSGTRRDLYAYAGIDAAHIVNAALLALDLN